MPYELLYSRTISGEGVARYTDVPITEKSVMIEVLSLLSPFRRIAGYAYALRSDGITDYERSGGVTLPFGKNRVNFAVATVPYGLEFFPKWGMKTGIISVYTGEPGGQPEPGVWKQAAVGPYQMRLNTVATGASYRTSPINEVVDSQMNGAIEGFMYYDYVFWRVASGAVFFKPIGPTSIATGTSSDGDYQTKKFEAGVVIL